MTTRGDVTLDDGAPAPGLSALARLKLSRELATIKTDLAAMAAGPSTALTRLKRVARANLIRAQLGGSAVPMAIAPAPVPDVVRETPEIAELRDVVAGRHDGLGLDGLLTRIENAVRALFDAGSLVDEIETLAHDAVTYWARLELQTHG